MSIVAKELFQSDKARNAEGQPITVGVFVEEWDHTAGTSVHLLAVEENKGPSLFNNIWAVANEVSLRFAGGQPVDRINWTITAGTPSDVTRLALTSFNRQPFKIDISEGFVVHLEYDRQLSFDRHKELYGDRSPFAVIESKKRTTPAQRRATGPETVFSIPFNDWASSGRLLNCLPTYYASEHMRNAAEYILVDTKKLADHLRRDEEALLKHTAHKMEAEGSKLGSWLRPFDFQRAHETGCWGGSELAMISGDVSLVEFIMSESVPYLPVAVSNHPHSISVNEVRSRLGFEGEGQQPSLPSFAPKFGNGSLRAES